jgi:hypothetical protein
MLGWKRHGRAGRLLVALLALDIALGLVYGALLLRRPSAVLNGRVVDAFSGEPVGGVSVTVSDRQATTDEQGAFRLPAAGGPDTVVVQPSAGHGGGEQAIGPGDRGTVTVALRPTVVSGRITAKANGAPLVGIGVRAVNARGEQSGAAVTDADGRYALQDVPDGARLVVEGPDVARQEVEIGQRTTVDLALRPDVLAGTVRTKDGTPLAGATVAAGAATATTGADGAYTLHGIPENAQVVVKARGYQPRQRAVEAAATLDVTLDPLVVKAIYLTPDSIGNEQKFNALLALADRTELTAMVLDFKDESGWLRHDSKVAPAQAVGAVHPEYDLAARLRTLKEHNLYAIARIVCFQDPTLATKRPDLAVRNTATGGVWKNNNGVAWVSAMHPEAWDYNAAIAVEAARLGFDEVQYDYVRFPTDGDREVMDLGAPSTKETRTDAIAGFLKRTREALAPYGTALAVDVFGVALFDKNDNDGIGQSLEKIAPQVDYICPMVYPSHYIPGIFGFDLPNDHPYEIVLGSLQLGVGRVPNPQVALRPWLQDFSYGRGIDYGPNEVRAQIKAAHDFGASGWMLWNAANQFSEAALLPKGR